ncbi:ABC transporter permease (plasmid) [Rhodococcus aetherivorans]|uniref:ABC transporter permease n=1 Tax=Rhodococcus aetherivorans TaxID=191292 RepID=UPI0026ECAE36|nr:ABC transporter permease [Rhodococcus aetherivorans]WKX01702.1 ABC transporter permease [Rhodococcus aetherivorans]
MSAPTTRSHASVPQHTGTDVRPSVVRLLWDQLGYAVRDLWRTRVAFIFTFLFPLTFLVVLGAMVGTETISADSTVRVMQFVSPAAAVMGALYGTYPTVASSLADARERGVLKRVHGTPLPGWVYLAGRIGAAVLFALGSLTLMLSVGVIAYGVQIQWHTMPATVVTVLAAVTCFAALGVAVAGLARSALVAQAVSIATAVVLSWISGVMGYGDMPTWADRIAQIFPLKPFNDALAVQFDPFATGTGWDLAALAVLGAWAIGAVVVASLTFRWDPAAASGHRRPVASGPGPTEAGPSPVSGAGVVVSVAAAGRPSRLALLSAQARWATRSALHDTAWVFFALAMPVAQYLFSAAVIGDGAAGTELTPPFGLQSATGMIAWGAIVTAMVFMPDAIARARDRGILTRLRGTPLQIGIYFAGRFVSAFLLVLATAVSILLAGMLWFDLEIAWRGSALAVGLLVLGTATLAACGLLLVSVLPSSKAVTAVGLGVAIPLAFFSDVFAIEAVPQSMSTVGAFFPLKHLANSMSYALDPAGPTISWLAVAVMTVWLVATGLLAARLFRWSPRT